MKNKIIYYAVGYSVIALLRNLIALPLRKNIQEK